MIFKDLSEASPSYNNILVVDDAGQKFFDYYPDIPVRFLTTPPTRTLTLQAQGNISNFYFLSQDNEAGPTMLYDPVAAYTIGPAPTDFNLAATVTFQSLNHQSFITSPSIGNRPNFWNEATVLMLDTPAQLRPMNAGTIDLNAPPRSPLFIGQVTGDNLDSLATNSEFGALLNMTDPITAASLTTADYFLRNLPSMGGGQPFVRLRAVKIIKYYLSPTGETTDDCKRPDGTTFSSSRLYRTAYRNRAFDPPFLLDNKICQLEITRSSIGVKVVNFNLVKPLSAQSQPNGGN